MALVNLWTLRCDAGCGATSARGKTVRGGETCPACLARMRLRGGAFAS